MIADKGSQASGRRVSSPDHVFGDAGLADLDSELKQLAMDPRRSPQRIGNAHLADQPSYFDRNRRSAGTRSRLPAPVRSEPGAVPFNHGLRLHDRQGAP